MDFVSKELCSLFCLFAISSAYPVTQPVYPNQYVSAQAIPGVQYSRQPQTYTQAQYIPTVRTARPVFESDRGQGLQKYSTQIKQPIQQVLLATNVDRQIQRAAQAIGPLYLQQIQAAQQQGQLQEALAVAQRKGTSQTLGRQVQPIPIPQQPQPQYIRELPQQAQPTYIRPIPVAQGYRQALGPKQQQAQRQQESEPEDYEPNPSYQFGFDVNDDQFTNYQNRKEQREGDKITGSYSVVDSDGFIRTVTYTADPKEGFKAKVTREPTNIVVKIPKHDPQFDKQPTQYIQQADSRQRGEAQDQYQYQ